MSDMNKGKVKILSSIENALNKDAQIEAETGE